MLNKITTHPVSAGLLSAGLLLLPLWFPLLTPVQAVVPLPLLLVTLRAGHRAGWQAVTLLLLCAWLVGGGLLFPVAVFLLFAGFPLLAVWLWRAGWQTSYCAFAAFVLANLVLVGVLGWAMLGGVDLPARLAGEMNLLKDEVLTALTTRGMTAMALAEFRTGLEQLIALISLLLPAMVLTSWFLIQVGNLLVARALVSRWGETGLADENLVEMRLPFALVWAVIAMALLAMFAHGVLRHLGINWGMLLAVPYFFQGLAIVQRAFQWYNVGGMVRGILFTALFVWTGMVLLVLLIGLFDTWVDFRLRFFYNREGQTPSGR
ncbi:MAG: YybS family protein [Magnetococcus sp. DMHC-8]